MRNVFNLTIWEWLDRYGNVRPWLHDWCRENLSTYRIEKHYFIDERRSWRWLLILDNTEDVILFGMKWSKIHGVTDRHFGPYTIEEALRSNIAEDE